MEEDQEVRQCVYEATVEQGRPPTSEGVANALDRSQEEVLEAFQRLQERRLLVLGPDSGEIVMAPPFSAAPTSFLVRVDGSSYFANCVWDAFGVAAALRRDATVDSGCACCGEPMILDVRDGAPLEPVGVAHFAVPAAHWWDDITYT